MYKKMKYTVFLKAFWTAFSSKQTAGISWERSNGAGEGEKKLAFHSCVHATSSKTAKLLQLACTQLCFLLEEDPFNEF
jgi:geranylgeranyl pyrophosphate synthase